MNQRLLARTLIASVCSLGWAAACSSPDPGGSGGPVAGSGSASSGGSSAGANAVGGTAGTVNSAGSGGSAGQLGNVGGVGGAGSGGASNVAGSGGVGTGGTGGSSALRCDIEDYGALGDGVTLNTVSIQAAIDACAAEGGTVQVPEGNFLTGALFLKPHANLELLEGSVLQGSKNPADFPIGPSRFEGHFQDRPASLLNGEGLENVRISGPGTLDGNGAAYWSVDAPQGRPRLAFIRDSKNVVVSGVHFKNSPSWNLHFYNSQQVLVEDSRFEIDDDGSGPSTDGTVIDSSQDVTVQNCYYSVNDDCVVLKGNRYDGLDQTPASLPVSNVHVTGCTFVRGKGAFTLGTEATYIHDVEFDNSTVYGDFPTLRLKIRPDTAGQRYENIHVHDIVVDGTDDILGWELKRGTEITGTAPPAFIKNITIENVTGKTAAFGNIAANDTTEVSGITLRNFDVTLTTPTLVADGVEGLSFDNVVVNGELWSTTGDNGKPGPAN